MREAADTRRIVRVEELPASAQAVKADAGLFDGGVLMGHQIAWLQLKAQIKLAEKGRRTGITFAEALDSTITAASQKSAGGMDVFYMGDTKEKGLEFIGYCARFSRVLMAAQAGDGVSQVEEFLFDDQDDSGNTRQIQAYRIRYASGFKIVALSSNPANIRGLQGKVIIDEAAFHKDVAKVLDAATALLIWGGRIVIVSTHNGKANAFNQMANDIREGRYGEDAKVMRITFDDAVENGLYERVCLMQGTEPTPEGKQAWYGKIRAAYGPRAAQMREELDAIPRDGTGVCVPGVWVEDAMTPDRPVLRLLLSDDFVQQSVRRREGYVEEWMRLHLHPELAKLDKSQRHYLGMDYARHRDFSIICPVAITPSRVREVPFVVEMQRVPARQQQQILNAIIRALPKFGGAALDASGNGETLAEDTADTFGRSRIHQIKLSRTWYGAWMPKLVQLFEDGQITIPRDDNLAQDIRAIELVDGIPMVAKARRQDMKEPELYRHGDFAGALVLANYAVLAVAGDIPRIASRPRRERIDLLRGYA